MSESGAFAGRFGGRAALVTGSARGIGFEVARRIAAEGARVVLVDRDAATLTPAVEAIRRERGAAAARGEAVDVADPRAVAAAVDRVAADLGGVDVLVNNAGILRDGWIDRLSDEDWSAVLGVNLSGAFHCCRAVVPHMKRRGYGRIVNLSSRSWMGNPGQSNYAAAKAGLVGLTRTLALELVGFGITVNAVAPGLIDTPMTRALPGPVRERLIAAQPGGRAGTPAEVAAAILFLASEEASFVTGQVLHVCGGKSVGMAGVA